MSHACVSSVPTATTRFSLQLGLPSCQHRAGPPPPQDCAPCATHVWVTHVATYQGSVLLRTCLRCHVRCAVALFTDQSNSELSRVRKKSAAPFYACSPQFGHKSMRKARFVEMRCWFLWFSFTISVASHFSHAHEYSFERLPLHERNLKKSMKFVAALHLCC